MNGERRFWLCGRAGGRQEREWVGGDREIVSPWGHRRWTPCSGRRAGSTGSAQQETFAGRRAGDGVSGEPPERRMSAPSPGRTATTPVVRHTDWTTGALATPAFLAAVLSRPRRVRNLALIKDCRPFLVFEAVALHTGIMEPYAVRPRARLPRLASPVRLALLMLPLVALISLILSAVAPPASAVSAPHVLARTAALVDGASGAVIWQRDAHRPGPVASTTKILTALVADDTYVAGKVFTVPQAAEEVDGTRLGYQTGMRVRRHDLLTTLLLVSANDAAETLARAYPRGGRAGFLTAMQAEAESFGCSDSTWRDPSGLDASGHRASAADLAILGRVRVRRHVRRRPVHVRLRLRYPRAKRCRAARTRPGGPVQLSWPDAAEVEVEPKRERHRLVADAGEQPAPVAAAPRPTAYPGDRRGRPARPRHHGGGPLTLATALTARSPGGGRGASASSEPVATAAGRASPSRSNGARRAPPIPGTRLTWSCTPPMPLATLPPACSTARPGRESSSTSRRTVSPARTDAATQAATNRSASSCRVLRDAVSA